MMALGVLMVGVLGVAGVITAGMKTLGTTPADVISAQKAAQAVEAVFSARDSHKLTWAQIKNVTNGGVFKNGPQPLNESGPDGLVNTTDDLTTIESVAFPGPDQLLGTGDDRIDTLTGYRREVVITEVSGTNGNLRKVTVNVSYQAGADTRTFTLTTFISIYS